VFVQNPRTRQVEQVVCPCAREIYEAERAAVLREMCNVDDETLARFTFGTFVPGKCAAPRGQMGSVRRTMAEVKVVCEEFAALPTGWLLLAGNVGSGKSHLAFAIANALLARGVGVYWETVPELLDALRAGFGDGSYTDRLQLMQRVPVLILDDLGTENSTQWVSEKLFQLLNHRYMKNSPTVVTTNLDVDDPEVKLSARIRSRLLDRSLSTVVRLPAGDYRVPMEG
jgi:DNA replication protein DnaC